MGAKADYYRSIIGQISQELLHDADKDLEGGYSYFEVNADKYKIYSTRTEQKALANLIRDKDFEISNLKAQVANYNRLYLKEKMGHDKKVLLRETDYTQLRNIKKYIDGLFERKAELEKE